MMCLVNREEHSIPCDINEFESTPLKFIAPVFRSFVLFDEPVGIAIA